MDLSGIFSHFVLNSNYFLGNKDQGGQLTPSILFCLFDAGETLALQPVIDEMTNEQIPFQILAFGTAWSLVKDRPECIHLNNELGWPPDLDPKLWERYQPVNENFLLKVRFCACPDIIITGMVSEFQLQICRLFKPLESEILAYYDAFSLLKAEHIQAKFVPLASQVLVPSLAIAKSIHKLFKNAIVHVVGQPSLEYWLNTDHNSHFESIKDQLDLKESKPTLLFIGGYGHDYMSAFPIFAKAVPLLQDLHIIFSIHPKTDGLYEKELLGTNQVIYISHDQNITTSQLVSLADIVLTINSTVGIQAAFLGKPVIYVHTPEMRYTSLSIELKWADRITDSLALKEQIEKYAHLPAFSGNRYLDAEIPQRATHEIFKRISITQKWLKKRSQICCK